MPGREPAVTEHQSMIAGPCTEAVAMDGSQWDTHICFCS